LALAREAYPLRDRPGGIDGYAQAGALCRLELELHNRVLDVARAYVFMMFYFTQGIPDQRWHISPGRKGQSIEYFPDFEEKHFVMKGWFDFYADTFYQKLFATWSVVGHLLNAMFLLNLSESQVDFGPAVDRLKGRGVGVAVDLASVADTDAFRTARKLRNDITHNEAPSSVGMTVAKTETATAVIHQMGTRSYVTSGTIVDNAEKTIALLRRTLELLHEKAT
jgi:hypothetical protein